MIRAGIIIVLLFVSGCGRGTTDSSVDRLIKQSKHADPMKRLEAVKELANRGGDATATIDALVTALGDTDAGVSRAAAKGLERIGNPTSDALIAALKSDNSAVRAHCTELLGHLSKPGDKVAPAILSMLKDRDAFVRASAASVLKKKVSLNKSAVPDLAAALNDDSAIVRLDIVQCLGKLGPSAEAAVPALQKLLKDPDEKVREATHAALESIR